MRDAEHRREENFQSGPPCAPAHQKQDSRCFSLLMLLILQFERMYNDKNNIQVLEILDDGKELKENGYTPFRVL